MFRAPVACPDCGQPSVRGARYCEKHVQNNAATTARREANTLRNRHDSVGGMYDRQPWPGFQARMIRNNVICQRLNRGVRCRNLSKIVHHLIGPRQRPDLFVDPKNVVCLCRHCHPPDEGTPHWREGVDFVPTVCPSVLVG
jgi:hypothetical protein